ncbi:MAG: DUF1501 domain-containing protein [Planctomycetota bacterium]
MNHFNTLNRRSLLTAASAASVSQILGRAVVASEQSQGRDDSRRPRFKRCVTLWMQGGPSQFETIDPKPDSSNGGPLTSVASGVPGIAFCETLGKLAERANEMCLLRSVGSKQGEHERASYLLHTGFEKIDSFPRPSLASAVANGSRQGGGIPPAVTLGGAAYGAAFLGPENAPFVISELESALETVHRARGNIGRLKLVEQLNAKFGQVSLPLKQRSRQIQTARELLGSSFADSMNFETESEQTRRRYGENGFGNRVLAARRMLEAGVRYVEVQMPGWDTHVGNFDAVKRLCQQLEPAWISLADDLKANGLWEETLILWMGEFGRTPVINGQNGRDHFPRSIPVALMGAGLDGQVIGTTGADGSALEGPEHSVADLMYTLMDLLGVDPDQEYTTRFGSPTTPTDGGSRIPIG